jgi:cardiolipin synthase
VRALIVVVGLTGVVLLVAQDQQTLKVQTSAAATDDRFAAYIASLTGSSVELGDHYQVLHNGAEAFPAMLAAIRAATQRISFENFIYQDGVVGDAFTTELSAAAGKGVAVRLVLDAFGTTLSERSRQRLTAAGVRIVMFNRVRLRSLEEVNYRTHRKILVVDGQVAFTGGMGLADHWLGHARNPRHWRDTQFEVTGPAVRRLEAAFYENWLEAGGLAAPALDPEQPSRRTGARSVVIWSNPSGGASRVKLMYLLSIAAARRRIDIQSPYFILDESTRWSLDAARRRGVAVRILTTGDITDAPPVKAASRHAYQSLLDAGYHVYEYQPTMMHVKTMVVDGAWSVIGTANFDNRSFELNDELTIGVQDAELAERLGRDFERDLAVSKELTRTEWRRRPIWQKARERFWSWFGELF